MSATAGTPLSTVPAITTQRHGGGSPVTGPGSGANGVPARSWTASGPRKADGELERSPACGCRAPRPSRSAPIRPGGTPRPSWSTPIRPGHDGDGNRPSAIPAHRGIPEVVEPWPYRPSIRPDDQTPTTTPTHQELPGHETTTTPAGCLHRNGRRPHSVRERQRSSSLRWASGRPNVQRMPAVEPFSPAASNPHGGTVSSSPHPIH